MNECNCIFTEMEYLGINLMRIIESFLGLIIAVVALAGGFWIWDKIQDIVFPNRKKGMERYYYESRRLGNPLLDFFSLTDDDESEITKEYLRISEEKKNKFTGGPWRFYYIDINGLNSLYNQIIPSMKTTEIELEKTGETSKSFSVRTPVVDPSYGKQDSKKEKEKMELSESPEMQYNEVFSHLMAKKLINFSIEEFIYNKVLEEGFLKVVNALETRIKYTPPSNKQYTNEFIHHNKTTHVDNKIEAFRNAIGKYVCIQGDFNITTSADDNILTYIHPISEVIEKTLTLTIYCSQRCMTKFGTETFSRLDMINARIFGSITHFDEEKSNIDINPITIH